MRTRLWDAAGMSLSALCLMHCLVLPVAAALLPVLGAFADADWVHWTFAATAAPITLRVVALALSARPAPFLMILAAAFGIALLFCGAFAAPNHAWGERLTLTGAALLCLAHVLNWRRRHPHL